MLRYVILLVTLLCMSFMLSNFILFYFTVICMDPHDPSFDALNDTTSSTANSYTPLEESWIFSALAVGRIAGALPTISMINRFGLGTTFTTFGVISGLATFAMPAVAESFNLVLGVRFAQGLGSASLFVAHGAVPLAWGGATEQGVFVSLLSCAYEIAPIMANSLSGYFCTSSYGWPGVYYLFGVLTSLCFGSFAFMYSDGAASNRFASSKRAARIHPVEAVLPPKEKPAVPYKAMLMSPSVWGVWMTALGDAVAYQMFSMYAPTYINKVLGFDVSNTGILAALPFLLAIGVKSFGGVFLDKATCIPSSLRVLGFTSVAQAAMTVCFFLLTLMTENDRILAQIILTLAICCSGLHCVGFFTASQIVAQHFNHVLTAGFAVLNAVIALLLPVLVAFVAPNHTNEEWAIVFYCMIAALTATNIAFVLLTKVKPATWTKKDMKHSIKFYDYS